MLRDQAELLEVRAELIIDVGRQDGQSTAKYVQLLPERGWSAWRPTATISKNPARDWSISGRVARCIVSLCQTKIAASTLLRQLPCANPFSLGHREAASRYKVHQLLLST
jgi:hypothetical protein